MTGEMKWPNRFLGRQEVLPDKKNPARETSASGAIENASLEDQPCSKLKFSWIEGSRDRTEVPGTGIETDATGVDVSAELGVIPGVECICAKLEAAAARFVDQEALEQREIPVLTAGATQRVESEIAVDIGPVPSAPKIQPG